VRRESQEWSSVRQLVLERDGHACVACSERLVGRDAHVHHVIPRALGGSDHPSNLISLCSGCHAAHHPGLQARLSRRLIERWAWRIARWVDHELPDLSRGGEHLGGALRLLGVERLKPGQLEIVLAALQGQSLLMVSPTGSGKSLCFQLPAILRPGTSIVVAPLKALMADQVSGLQRRKIPATFINSDLDSEEKEARYQLVERDAIKLLYCAPERFDATRVKPAEVAWLQRLRPSFLVVDEAHCIDKWGVDFRPSYARLGEVRRRLGSPPVLAFTATAGVRTQKRVLSSLGIPEATVFVRGVDRPNIAFLRLSEQNEAKRFQLIAALLSAMRHGRSMIFAPTIRIGHAIIAGLRDQGFDVPLFHGKLPPNEREFLLKRYLGELHRPLDAIVCTSAFGMGIDVPDVRLVIHWQHPASVEDYLQEFGRAGRNGRQALAILFRNTDDRGLHRFMIDKTLESAKLLPAEAEAAREVKLKALQDIHDLATLGVRCFRRALVAYFEAGGPKRSHSVGRWILQWAFAQRDLRARTRHCCDACARIESVKSGEHWAQEVLRCDL
jgi:ATP-dependent DNA helicase RecQ